MTSPTSRSLASLQEAKAPSSIASAAMRSSGSLDPALQIKNLTINGGSWGVEGREFSVCRFSGNTIQSATGNGVQIDSADATFTGDVIQNNANYGLNMTASRVRVTRVTVKGTTAGTSGPGNGVKIDSGSTLTVEQLTVQNNSHRGLEPDQPLLGGPLPREQQRCRRDLGYRAIERGSWWSHLYQQHRWCGSRHYRQLGSLFLARRDLHREPIIRHLLRPIERHRSSTPVGDRRLYQLPEHLLTL